MRRLINTIAFTLVLLGTIIIPNQQTQVKAAELFDTCTSAAGSRCDCEGTCWANATTCGCDKPKPKGTA